MRIVAGRWRGRKIEAPMDKQVRPTLDSVREAWMNILQLSIPGAKVLDLYAGSGALGLEALSRGAVHADFVEKDGRVVRALRRNVEMLDAGAATTVHQMDALRYVSELASSSYDIAFADPPYLSESATALANKWQLIPFAALLGIEHAASHTMPGSPEIRRYGSTAISIYRSED